MGAGSAALVATLLPRNGSRAGHDGTNVFHLGEDNGASVTTGLHADVEPNALMVLNETGSGIHAHAPGGIGLFGSSDTFRGVYGHSESDSGVHGDSVDGAGVFGASENGPGVNGASFSGTSTGVEGSSGSGPGVAGLSQSGPGVAGHSASGEGGTFSTETGSALGVSGPAHFFGDTGGFLVGLDNMNTGEVGGGMLANSRGGKPTIEADVFPSEFNPGVGVQGVSYTGTSYDDGDFAQGPGIGVQGLSGTGHGVEGLSDSGVGVRGVHLSEENFGPGVEGESPGVGVRGVSASGTGVAGDTEDGVGVQGQAQGHTGVNGWGSLGVLGTSHGNSPTMEMAGVAGAGPGDVPGVLALSAFANPEIPKDPKVPDQLDSLVMDGGLALDVVGKARFTTAGNDAVAAGDSSRFVANPAVTEVSHVSLTLNGDPGSRELNWVERHPGSGFTAHFAGGPPPQRPEVPFSYLIVEPAAIGQP